MPPRRKNVEPEPDPNQPSVYGIFSSVGTISSSTSNGGWVPSTEPPKRKKGESDPNQPSVQTAFSSIGTISSSTSNGGWVDTKKNKKKKKILQSKTLMSHWKFGADNDGEPAIPPARTDADGSAITAVHHDDVGEPAVPLAVPAAGSSAITAVHHDDVSEPAVPLAGPDGGGAAEEDDEISDETLKEMQRLAVVLILQGKKNLTAELTNKHHPSDSNEVETPNANAAEINATVDKLCESVSEDLEHDELVENFLSKVPAKMVFSLKEHIKRPCEPSKLPTYTEAEMLAILTHEYPGLPEGFDLAHEVNIWSRQMNPRILPRFLRIECAILMKFPAFKFTRLSCPSGSLDNPLQVFAHYPAFNIRGPVACGQFRDILNGCIRLLHKRLAIDTGVCSNDVVPWRITRDATAMSGTQEFGRPYVAKLFQSVIEEFESFTAWLLDNSAAKVVLTFGHIAKSEIRKHLEPALSLSMHEELRVCGGLNHVGLQRANDGS